MNYFEQISDRLYTSALQESDIEKWYPFFQDNDSLDYLGLDLSIPSEELAKGWISAQFKRYKESGFGHLAIRRNQAVGKDIETRGNRNVSLIELLLRLMKSSGVRSPWGAAG